MTIISLQDLQLDPQSVLDRVEAEERVVVSREGRPVAEFRRIGPAARRPRPFGLAAGEFTVPDDFGAPLPDDILQVFEGR